MKRITKILLSSILLLPILGSCKRNESNSNSTNPKENITTTVDKGNDKTTSKETKEDSTTTSSNNDLDKESITKIYSIIDNFDVSKTNGYDYSLNQYLNNSTTIVNSHTINLKLDYDNLTCTRVDTSKKLNNDVSLEQYTIITDTYKYSDNKCLKNDTSVDITFNKLIECNIKEFELANNSKLFDHADYSKQGKYRTLKIILTDNNAKKFLGINDSIYNLEINIKVDSNFEKLYSYTLSYSMDLTNTVISFTPSYN